ncbi:TetR/AcrR family transcriptional regulator [Micromonospora sp. MS34]|uniref:TetR/AcrR family transcriptional regulator n=1 Tax=Micromonospora sp. MS34 TaxID=3385971 RepID=UPI0039A1B1FD
METIVGGRAVRRGQVVDALLEATLQSLASVGFAATTTRGVAELAGVSQGAQQHYFPTKAALVDAAINRLADRLLDQAIRPLPGADERERAGRLIDGLWEAYHLPASAVLAELLALGRTHPDTAAKTAATLVAVTDRIVAVAHHALPSYRARADFREIVLVAVGAIRDAATVGRVPGTAPALPTLPAIRRAFLQALDGSAR